MDVWTRVVDRHGVGHIHELMNRDSHLKPDSQDNVRAIPVREVLAKRNNKSFDDDGNSAEVYTKTESKF